jgi:hypothetical protein
MLIAMTMLALMPGVVSSALADGNQSVRTESGRVRCYINVDDVGHGGGSDVVCQTSGPDSHGFMQGPPTETPGFNSDIVSVKPTGAFKWDDGNIPGTPEALAQDVVLNYGQTYDINGWAISPSVDGTRFTNDRTGYGMFVSVDNVYSF